LLVVTRSHDYECALWQLLPAAIAKELPACLSACLPACVCVCVNKARTSSRETD